MQAGILAYRAEKKVLCTVHSFGGILGMGREWMKTEEVKLGRTAWEKNVSEYGLKRLVCFLI